MKFRGHSALKGWGHSTLEFELSRAFRPKRLKKCCAFCHIFENAQAFRLMIWDISLTDLKVCGYFILEFEISRAFRPKMLNKFCAFCLIFENAQAFRLIFKITLAFRSTILKSRGYSALTQKGALQRSPPKLEMIGDNRGHYHRRGCLGVAWDCFWSVLWLCGDYSGSLYIQPSGASRSLYITSGSFQ